MKAPKLIWVGIGAIFISGFWFLALTERSNFFQMLGLFAGLFTIYALGWKKLEHLGLVSLLALFLAVRLPFFFSLPELSDDFYRFLWDGMLLFEGWSPFTLAPAHVALDGFSDPEAAKTLLQGMNSPGYISVYPPIHQGFFALGHLFSQHSLLTGVNAMRAAIVGFELLMLWFALSKGAAMRTAVAAYLLNPLVIAEGVGNLHLEAAMLPLLVIAILSLNKGAVRLAGLAWAGSALVKLTPLALAPQFWWRLGWKQRLAFFIVPTVLIIASAIWMLPAWSEIGTGGGLGVYFKTFEFNASVYYVLSRGFEWGWGYNPIGFLGPGLALISVGAILLISYKGRKANIWEVTVIIYLIFYLLSTTVHPWYVIPVVFFAIAAKRPLLLIWSFTAWFSYSHYVVPDGPKWFWIGAEYLLLLAALTAETRRKPWLQPFTEAGELRG